MSTRTRMYSPSLSQPPVFCQVVDYRYRHRWSIVRPVSWCFCWFIQKVGSSTTHVPVLLGTDTARYCVEMRGIIKPSSRHHRSVDVRTGPAIFTNYWKHRQREPRWAGKLSQKPNGAQRMKETWEIRDKISHLRKVNSSARFLALFFFSKINIICKMRCLRKKKILVKFSVKCFSFNIPGKKNILKIP